MGNLPWHASSQGAGHAKISTKPGGKRKAVVDLTGDDATDRINPNKTARTNVHQLASHARCYPTPPAPSQPHSSQVPSSSQQRRCYDSTPCLLSQPHGRGDRDSWLGSTQENEGEILREINLEEDFDDDVYANHQLYGILNAKIVGCRYYDGRATVGEYVKVRREPRNPYDCNAIRIDNVMGDQIGHISRQIAAKLAPLMDSQQLLIEGALTGPKTYYDCPIGLKMFGTSDPVASAVLKQQMQDLHLPVAELNKAEAELKKREKEIERQRAARQKAAVAMKKKGGIVVDREDPDGPGKYSKLGGMPNGQHQEPQLNMDQLLSGAAMFNPRDVQDAVNNFVAGEDILSKLPMAEQPAQVATMLLPYQRQGLQWMLDHESPKLPEQDGDAVQMWKKSHGFYTNIATSFSVTKAPDLASGGILADDMGLGKTLQTISLIMADPQKTKQPTLIVCPLSVMSNWSGQAAYHVKKKFAPRMLTYHGPENRSLDRQEFEDYDIVITTYQTMTYELFARGKDMPASVPTKKGLFSVTWRRVVLDEGHSIRNPKAKMAIAASTLMAKSRWVLTGTPIVNNLKDLYSHAKFLRLTGGMSEFEIFNGTLIRPLKHNDPNARILLQSLMASLCLRRMKDMKFIDLKLPNITFHKYPVKLLAHEQERYDAFKAEAKGHLEAVKAKQGDSNTYAHLLEVLLRLRQTCNHWKLCGDDRVRKILELADENKVIDVTNLANRVALQDLLQLRIDSQEECPVCMDTIESPVITACSHAFCRGCVERVIQTQAKCPMCRADLPSTDLLVEPAANFGEGEDEIEIDGSVSSSKIEALVQVLKVSSAQKGIKTVVFSQWTSFLDIVQKQLLEHGFTFTRIDGKMNATKRDAALELLNTDDDCKILLASLGVCSVGLNLVAASQVILSDSWWAPAIEDQAVDRVHRLGQTRDCKVVRLVVEDSIEDEVLEIQEKKRKLAGLAFGEKEGQRSRKEMRAGGLRDIEKLLGERK